MLPLILGAVALGTVGYGVKKCLTDEDCIDNVKDKIQDGAFWAYEGIEKVEEKMGLYDNEIVVDKDSAGLLTEFAKILTGDTDTTAKTSNETLQNHFKGLYKLKLDTVAKIAIDNKEFSLDIKVKEDKTKDITITPQMIDNLNGYNYTLSTICNKIKLAIETKDETSLDKYYNIVKNICETKIIKKGKLNDKSSDVILEATKIIFNEPIYRTVESDEKMAS
jgi:hypothetical protein